MGNPGRGHPQHRKEKQDKRLFPQLTKGSQVGTGDPLPGLTCGVQCWKTWQLRRSHVIFPIVFYTRVRNGLSVPCGVLWLERITEGARRQLSLNWRSPVQTQILANIHPDTLSHFRMTVSSALTSREESQELKQMSETNFWICWTFAIYTG